MCLQSTHEQKNILSSNSHDSCEDVTATVTTRDHQKVPRTVVGGGDNLAFVHSLYGNA